MISLLKGSPPMVRIAALAGLLAGAMAFTSATALAESAPRHTRKAAHAGRPVASVPSPAGNINAPSTDFSKVERSEDTQDEHGASTLHPTMGAGGMGFGGGF